MAAGFTIPLNPDPYLDITIQLANSFFFFNTLGTLDQNGESTAVLFLPPIFPNLAGVVLHHAFGTFDAGGVPSMVSEAAELDITP